MRLLFRSAPVLALLALAACAGGSAAAPSPTATSPAAATSSATVAIPVNGMSCGGCVRRVTNALRSVDGVSDVTVSLAEKRAVVSYDPARVQPAALAAAISDAGYEPGAPSPVRN